MKAINNKQGINIALRVAVIAIVCAVIVWVMPKVGTFQYEYEAGMPWRYETLNAPFDFPIYKTESEIEESISNNLKNHSPLFNKRDDIGKTASASICQKIASIIGDTTKTYRELADNIERIYAAGVIQYPESMQESIPARVKIVEKNFGQEIETNTLFTPKEAYIEIIELIETSPISQQNREDLKRASLNEHLTPNVIFDEAKNRSELQKIQNTTSPTKGMVTRGDQIIAKREIVTNDKIQLLNSLKTAYQTNANITFNNTNRITIGQSMLVLLALVVYSIFFFYSKRNILYNNKSFIFLYVMLLAMALSGALAYHENLNFYAIPVLFFVIVVNILIGSRSALYLLISGTILLSCFAPDRFEYACMQLTAGIVGIFLLSSLQRRGQLFLATLMIYVTYVVAYIALTLMKQGSIQVTALNTLLWLLVNCLLLTLAYPVIYLFERVFGFTSETTLIELSNPHHPALRELTKKAPGTFQHSLMVANMAEEAIYRIGGNVLLTRTGALYHDIGKSETPFLFIENQSGGVNPHNTMEFDQSAQSIIHHVEAGVELAKHYNLPDVIVQFIRTHHGKSRVKYFYNSYRNKYPDAVVDEDIFTYKGPDPSTKECSVVMMADAVEAVVRTLKEKSEESISNTISNIIDAQIAEGRFKDSDVTFKDISLIKEAFLEVLTSVYHSRVAYPKLNFEKEKKNNSLDLNPSIDDTESHNN